MTPTAPPASAASATASPWLMPPATAVLTSISPTPSVTPTRSRMATVSRTLSTPMSPAAISRRAIPSARFPTSTAGPDRTGCSFMILTTTGIMIWPMRPPTTGPVSTATTVPGFSRMPPTPPGCRSSATACPILTRTKAMATAPGRWSLLMPTTTAGWISTPPTGDRRKSAGPRRERLRARPSSLRFSPTSSTSIRATAPTSG